MAHDDGRIETNLDKPDQAPLTEAEIIGELYRDSPDTSPFLVATTQLDPDVFDAIAALGHGELERYRARADKEAAKMLRRFGYQISLEGMPRQWLVVNDQGYELGAYDRPLYALQALHPSRVPAVPQAHEGEVLCITCGEPAEPKCQRCYDEESDR